MKSFFLFAVAILLSFATLVGCGRKDDNSQNWAAVPNSYCQAGNQGGCWPQGYANQFSPYSMNGGCQGAYPGAYTGGAYPGGAYPGGTYPGAYPGGAYPYVPVVAPPYGAACIPNSYLQGFNPYYGANYNSYYQFGTYGYNQVATACDLYVQSGCAAGTFCRDVGMGRFGICSHY